MHLSHRITVQKLEILLMEEILHQLRLVVYPIIHTVLYIPGGAGFLLSTVSFDFWILAPYKAHRFESVSAESPH